MEAAQKAAATRINDCAGLQGAVRSDHHARSQDQYEINALFMGSESAAPNTDGEGGQEMLSLRDSGRGVSPD